MDASGPAHRHGGAGRDRLRGGGGADVYVFDDRVLDGKADTIVGLSRFDVVDLSAIDADATVSGDQTFALVEAFSGQAGELVLQETGRSALLLMDVDGDGEADASIKFIGSKNYAENIDLVL